MLIKAIPNHQIHPPFAMPRLLKALLLAGLARLLGFAWAQSLHLGMLLSQGGEFSFVLLGAALAVGILASADGQLLVLVVTLTMMATPLLARLGRGVEQRAERSSMIPVEEASHLAQAVLSTLKRPRPTENSRQRSLLHIAPLR